jgi:hypothetical protein
VASLLQRNIFDYSDGAIALRTLASLNEDPQLRPAVLDALWLNTKERALFLLHRVCCVLNESRIDTLLEELEELMGADGFISTSRTPNQEIGKSVARLLAALGFECLPISPAEAQDPNAAQEPWDSHDVVEDMRASRLAGSGKGGQKLTPLEDAIRRVKVILAAANHLTPARNGGEPVSINGEFGRAELLAVRDYVSRSVGALTSDSV